MEIIKSAINNIDNISDFAKSASGPMSFKSQDQSEPYSCPNGTYG